MVKIKRRLNTKNLRWGNKSKGVQVKRTNEYKYICTCGYCTLGKLNSKEKNKPIITLNEVYELGLTSKQLEDIKYYKRL